VNAVGQIKYIAVEYLYFVFRAVDCSGYKEAPCIHTVWDRFNESTVLGGDFSRWHWEAQKMSQRDGQLCTKE
jgi:hypothetical protein